MTTIVMGGPYAGFAEAHTDAGYTVVHKGDGGPVVLWGAGAAGAEALAAAAGRADVVAVVALAPDVPTVARALRRGDLRGARGAWAAGPVKAGARLDVPVLVQVADEDRTAPPEAAMAAAWAARAVVHHYPCDHGDVLAGGAWFDAALRHQLAFLARVL
ncbi:MAG: uncharacterized protein QOF76_397 [Solirubrobacteraceae bacterium]|nr:uncharacterized protein [Solirubrobacteraceae bacterium]